MDFDTLDELYCVLVIGRIGNEDDFEEGESSLQVLYKCGSHVDDYDIFQIGALCFPYNYKPSKSQIIITTVNRKGGSVLAARRFGYMRRTQNNLSLCLLTRQHTPMAASILAVIEDYWFHSHNKIDLNSLPLPPVPNGLFPYGTLAWDISLMGCLIRRFRRGNDLRRLIFAVLTERRILFISKDEQSLSRCVAAAAALPELAGLVWHHILSCCLPASLAAYAGSPSPYIMGFHTDKVALIEEQFSRGCHEELVVCNIETGSVSVMGTAKVGLDRIIADAEGLKEISSQFFREIAAISKRSVQSHQAALKRRRRRTKKQQAPSSQRNQTRSSPAKVVSGTKAMASKVFSSARGKLARTAIFKNNTASVQNNDSGSSSGEGEEFSVPLKEDTDASPFKTPTSIGEDDDDEFEEDITDQDTTSALTAKKENNGKKTLRKDEDCFDDGYFSEEDDIGDAAKTDVAAFKTLRNFVRAIVNADNWLVASVSSQQSDRDILERARADYEAASPMPEVAREFATTQMFAHWVLDGILKFDEFRPDTQCWLQFVQALGKYSDFDKAIVSIGRSLRLASDSLREVYVLASKLWIHQCDNLNKIHAHRCALLRCGSLLYDSSRGKDLDIKHAASLVPPRSKKLGPRPGPDSRLAACAFAIAQLLSGPGAILAILRNELRSPIRRAASNTDEDPLLRSFARIALRLISDTYALETARVTFKKKNISMVQDAADNDRLGSLGGLLPTFSHLHVDHNPREQSIQDKRLQAYANKDFNLLDIGEESRSTGQHTIIATRRHIIANHSPHDLDLLSTNTNDSHGNVNGVTHFDPFDSSTLIATPANRPPPPPVPQNNDHNASSPPSINDEQPLLDFSTMDPSLAANSIIVNRVPSITRVSMPSQRPPPPPPPLLPKSNKSSNKIISPSQRPPPPPPPVPDGGFLCL